MSGQVLSAAQGNIRQKMADLHLDIQSKVMIYCEGRSSGLDLLSVNLFQFFFFILIIILDWTSDANLMQEIFRILKAVRIAKMKIIFFSSRPN